MPKTQPHKPVSEARERIEALRAELHQLYEKSERSAATIRRMEQISEQIRKEQQP